MFNKQGLILNVLLAIVAGFFMNYALYNLPPQKTDTNEEIIGWCGTYDLYSLASLPIELQAYGQKGEEIFEANCAQCHAINEQVVGPALKDVAKRWPKPKELVEFIRYPQKMIDSGKSPYATALYQKYKQYMPDHDFLTDEDVRNVLIYVRAWTDYPPGLLEQLENNEQQVLSN